MARQIITALALVVAVLVGFCTYVVMADPAWWSTAWPVAVPVLSGDLLLGGFYWWLSNKQENARAARADKRAFQHTLYVADLTGINMQSADLTELNFGSRDLTGADLSGSVLTGADLSGSVLTGAKLVGADLVGADLRLAKLDEAKLGLADLTDANFAMATLTDAELIRVNLTGANLRRASMAGADLAGAKWDPKNPPTWPDGFDPPENLWEPEHDG